MLIRKLAAAAAIALFAASPALAQTADKGPDAFERWDNTVRETFFNDDLSIRSETQIGVDWEKLTGEQQAMVRDDCSRASFDSDTNRTEMEEPTDPVPGVADMQTVCRLVETM